MNDESEIVIGYGAYSSINDTKAWAILQLSMKIQVFLLEIQLNYTVNLSSDIFISLTKLH